MSEDGLERLEYLKFPVQCELDPNLLSDIATKAAPGLRELVLTWQKDLEPKGM